MAQQGTINSAFSMTSVCRYREVDEDEDSLDHEVEDLHDDDIVTVSQHVDTRDSISVSVKDLSTPDTPKAPSPACSADDLSDDFSEDDFEEAHLSRCNRFQRSGVCSLTLYLWISVFVVGCFIALVVVGVLVVGPYHHAASFVHTVCNTSGFYYPPEEHHCACGKGCTSLYPCLEVTVVYQDLNRKRHLAALHDTESSLDREVSHLSFLFIIFEKSEYANAIATEVIFYSVDSKLDSH